MISEPKPERRKPWLRPPIETSNPGTSGDAASSAPAPWPRNTLLRQERVESPATIPWAGWRAALRRTFNEMLSERISIVAAGCAFYATLALFPAISMLISVYGLLSDPMTILPQLAFLQDLLPPAAFQIITERVQMLTARPPASLGFNLLVSTALTLWSAMAGAKSLITALNLAYQQHETRGFVRYQLVALTFTLCMIIGSAAGLSLLVALPTGLLVLGIASDQRVLIHAASWAALVGSLLLALSLLYRHGPSRDAPRWRWVIPGSLVATLVWMAASALFSWYVATLATYDATYGSLGAVVAVMMWFYVTAYAVLLGAELNAELESQRHLGSTRNPHPLSEMTATATATTYAAQADGEAPHG